MMKKNFRAIVSTVAAVLLWSEASAVTYEFSNKYSLIDRKLNEPTVYTTTSPAFPGTGTSDDWQVAGYGSGVGMFTLSQTIQRAFRLTTFKIGGPSGKDEIGSGFNLNTGYFDIIFPERGDSDGKYQDTPIQFQVYYSDDEYGYQGDSACISISGCSNQHAPLLMRQLTLNATMVNGYPTWDFQSGSFNCYDPWTEFSGSATTPVKAQLQLQLGKAAQIGETIAFRKNMKVRAGSIYIYNADTSDYTKNRIEIDGASVYAENGLNNQYSDVIINNGAVVDVGKIYGNGGKLTLSDDAELYATNAASSVDGGILVDGTKLTLTGQFDGGSNSEIIFTNGAEVTCAKIYSNGTLGFYGGSKVNFTTDARDMTFYGKTTISGPDTKMLLVGGTVGVANPGIEILDGATLQASGIYWSSGQAHFVVGENATFILNNSIYLDTDGSYNMKYVRVDGGSFTCENVYLGSGTGRGRLQLDSGTVKITGGEGIKMQCEASTKEGNPAELIVNGGTLNVGRIRAGRKTSASQSQLGTTRIEINGGLVKLTDMDTSLMFMQNTTGAAYTHNGKHYLTLNGGVLDCYRIQKGPNTTGNIYFSANGGTYRAAANTWSTTKPSIANIFTTTEFGEKGLTIDSAGYTTYVCLDPVNASGAEGRFAKIGEGTLVYYGADAASNLEVSEGTFQVGDASTTFSGVTLTLTNNATFSMNGAATSVTFDAVKIADGIIELDINDVIEITGAVDIQRMRINWTIVPTSATAFLRIDGELTDAQKKSIKSTEFVNSIADNQHAAYTFSYSGGKTTVYARLANDTPITTGVIWKGTADSRWVNDANWEGGAAPVEGQRAFFTDATAPKAVTIESGAKASAISFGINGQVLSGNYTLAIYGEKGESEVAVLSGASNVVVKSAMSLESRTGFPIAAGSTLELGSVYGGAISKQGTGMLRLTGANRFDAELTSIDGIVSVENSDALSYSSADGQLTLKGGTAVFGGSSALHITDQVNVATTNLNGFAAFKADVDVTLDKLNVTSGSFIKHGVGTMTVNIPAGTTYQVGAEGGTFMRSGWSNNKPGIVFPEDGTKPEEGTHSGTGNNVYYRYAGFGVYEGELIFKGSGSGAKALIKQKTSDDGLGAGSIGSVSSNCQKDPVMTIDNVEFDSGSGFLIGDQLGSGGMAPKTATLKLKNNAKFIIRSTQLGYGCGGYDKNGGKVIIEATDSVFQMSGGGHITRAYQDPNSWVAFTFKDSYFYVDGAKETIGGQIKLDFDNSYFGGLNGAAIALDTEDDRPFGEMYFHNGSTLMLSNYTEGSNNKMLTFAFDDAEWAFDAARGDHTLAASTTGYVRYEMRGTGLKLCPVAGATYEINAPLEGDGGLVVGGAGVVLLGADTLKYTGASIVREGGTLNLSNITDPVSGQAFGGEGTFYKLNAEAPRIVAAFDNSWRNTNGVPVFADCTLDGNVTVLTSRTDEDPLEMPDEVEATAIAKIAGTTEIDISKWRLDHTGVYKANATFELIGDTVYLTPIKSTGAAAVIR